MNHRSWPLRLALALKALAAAAILTSAMAAPSPSDKATAKALFDTAKKYMAEKKYPEACERFAESHRLDPALGTQLNLGDCYEKDGRTMSAWTTFLAAAEAAKAVGQADRVKYAKERSAALEKRLVKIAIVVTSETPDLVIKRDGAVVTKLQFGVAIAVDPGVHTVEASAPGKQTVELKFTANDEGQTKTVTIPVLEATAPPLPSVSASAVPSAPPPKSEPGMFDKSDATSALKSVSYKDCGSGGAGKVSVTFATTGSVASAVVTAGDYDSKTKACIAGRFRAAKVPPFSDGPKTVGWSINL